MGFGAMLVCLKDAKSEMVLRIALKEQEQKILRDLL
jgi:hypothetical protein